MAATPQTPRAKQRGHFAQLTEARYRHSRSHRRHHHRDQTQPSSGCTRAFLLEGISPAPHLLIPPAGLSAAPLDDNRLEDQAATRSLSHVLKLADLKLLDQFEPHIRCEAQTHSIRARIGIGRRQEQSPAVVFSPLETALKEREHKNHLARRGRAYRARL